MKYLVILISLFLTACEEPPKEIQEYLPHGVYKFHDGNITCYTFFGNGISCVNTGEEK